MMKTCKAKVITFFAGMIILLCIVLVVMNILLDIDTAREAILLVVSVSVVFLAAGTGIGYVYVKRLLAPVDAVAISLTKLAKGQMDESLDMDLCKGEFRPIAEGCRRVQGAINKLLDDTGRLANAALDGQLTVRADASQHQGGYRDIIEGINATLDAVVKDFDSLPTPIMRIDKDFNICYINAIGAKLVDQTQQELIGSKCYDAFRTGDCQTEQCACYRAMQNSRQEERETDAHPNGADMEIKYSATPSYKEGEIIGALEVVTDLTEVKKAKAEIEKQAADMHDLIEKVDTAAEQVAAGTKQVSEGSQAISQGATEQASSIEELTASITQIAEQTKQNAKRANEANALTLSAKGDADQGNERMQAMQSAMTEINQASEDISKIIKVIDDIAFQTNILALNAAVEAARAGAHGKGFAVVAEEVRNLAARSANAAKETTALIEGSVKKTEAGTQIADETAQALANIVAGVETAAQLVGEIAAASEEQAGAITQVNGGIDQVNQVVQTNSATSEETAASAEELSSQAELLKDMVGRFTLKREAAQSPGEKPPEKAESIQKEESAAAQETPRIVLNDDEFGKY